MKRIISLVLLASLTLCILLATSSCSIIDKITNPKDGEDNEDEGGGIIITEYKPEENPIKEFYVNMLRAGSYQIDIKSSLDGRTETMILQYDGDIGYFAAPILSGSIGAEIYTYGGYAYGRNYGSNTAFEEKDCRWPDGNMGEEFFANGLIDVFDMQEFFEDTKYEKAEGQTNTYIMKDGYNATDWNCDNVKLNLDNGSCTISGIATYTGATLEFTFSRVGQITLNLPAELRK